MNILNELLAGKAIPAESIDARFFIIKKKTVGNEITYDLFFHDPRYIVPLFKDDSNDTYIKVYKSSGYQAFNEHVASKRVDAMAPLDGNREKDLTTVADSLEALQDIIDTRTGYVHDRSKDRVLDVSKLDIYDIVDDPDVIKKACA